MYLRPERPFSHDTFVPPVWKRTDHGSWEGRYGACGEAAYRLGGCLVTENDKGLQLFFYVPDIKADNLNVEVIDGVLRLSSNSDTKTEFSRSLSIDTEKFDISRADATLHDGVLRVTAPQRRAKRRGFCWKKARNVRQEPTQNIEVALLEPHEIKESTKQRGGKNVGDTDDSRDDTSTSGEERIIGMTVSF